MGAAVGPVWLSDEKVAAIIAESLHYRDEKVFRLDAFSIMSNHVHMVVKPLTVNAPRDVSKYEQDIDDVEYHSLARIMQSLKGYTAFQANRYLGREGEFWAHESYDHWIRDSDEWQRTVAYVRAKQPFESWFSKRLARLEMELPTNVKQTVSLRRRGCPEMNLVIPEMNLVIPDAN